MSPNSQALHRIWVLAAVTVLSTPLAFAQDQTGETPQTEQTGRELPAITPGPNMTLAEALVAANKRNLTLSAARIEIAKAEAQLSQAWALVLPGAQGRMQFMHRDHEDTVDFGQEFVVMPQHDLKGIIEVGLPLVNVESWHKISLARKGVEIARMSIEQARQQILLGVAQAYFMALMTGSLIGMYETQIESAAHHLKVAKARYDAGTGLRIDVIRAETDLEQAHQSMLSAHLAFDNARDALGVLTGVQGLPMPVEEAPIEAPAGTDQELTAEAVAARPDIKLKHMMVDLFRKQLDQSWTQFLPTLDAAWQMQYQFTKPGDMGSEDRSRWTALITLSVPLYNQFRYGDLDYKRAALRQAMVQRRDAERNISLEVRKARRDYLTALSSVDIAENQEKLAKEALLLVEASYNAGTGSSLDVTDARRTASSALINLVTKRLQAQINLLSLLHALGKDMIDLSR